LDDDDDIYDYDYDDGSQRSSRRGEGILAVTFTKKSAGEMERRLSELLSSATTTTTAAARAGPGMPPRKESSSSSSISTGGEDDHLEEGDIVRYGNADPAGDDDDEKNGGGNRSARELMGRTTVGTFHSVCSKVMRKFGRELGDLPSVRGCLGATMTNAFVRGNGDHHDDDDDGRYYGSTADNSNAATVQTLDGSFNILDQADQLRILKELLAKLNIQLKSPTPSFAGGGTNSNEIRPVTILNAISLLNTKDATTRGVASSSSSSSSAGGGGEVDDDVESKMSKKVYKIASEIRVPFQKAKYAQNSVDFDDLILLTRELLLRHPEVREALHRRWRHILVDEFQDTSRVQLDLVRLLTTNSLFVVGDGDQSIYSWRGASPESMTDFESAFHDRPHGWGGLLKTADHHGAKEGMSQYLERIGGVVGAGGRRRSEEEDVLKVKSVYLMENYRSTSNIVRAAQRIISTPERGGDDRANKSPTSAQDDIRRDMKPMRGDGPSPRVLACKDGKAEARFVVQTVNSMVETGVISPGVSTLAVIYRTNAQSRLIEEACVEHNLRYVVRGSSGTFYKRAEIQDCMAFLKVMYNPRDRSAWARSVKAPSRGIGDTSLNEFFRYCDAVAEKHAILGRDRDGLPTPLDIMISFARPDGASPVVDGIGALVPPRDVVSTRSMNRFAPFASSLRSLRRKAESQCVSDFLLSVIDDLGLKGHFDAISKTRDEYEDRLANVMELVRAAERYKSDGPCLSFPSAADDEPTETPLGNFLDDVALIADIAPDDEEEDGGGGRIVANLMTIHSSKGMEFDAVFLVGNEEGTFPTQRAIAEGERSIELSEEKRLCYVAMTRAKTHLVLTWRREVSFFSGATFKTKDADRSRFLDILVSKQGAAPGKGVTTPGAQAERRNRSLKKNFTGKSSVVGSMTKREIHTEASRLLASEDKSWGIWEPSSQKKMIRQIPSIELNSPANGVDQRPKLNSDQTRSRPIQNGIDRRQVITSPQSPSRPNYINSSRGGPIASQTTQRSMDSRQIHSSPRNTSADVNVPKKVIPSPQSPSRENHINSSRGGPIASQTTQRSVVHSSPRNTLADDVNVPKESNQTARRSNVDQVTLRGEPPPDSMDSTLFYPVGSSVRHKLHGRGVVQAPPDSDSEFSEKMLVRVKFIEESAEWDLPMNGLVHTYE
jgi:DNA helicase-2/ATP-dependent DNA helicase PcrA